LHANEIAGIVCLELYTAQLHLPAVLLLLLLTSGAAAAAAALQAAVWGDSEIVQLLLDAGARVDATDAQGRTALHHACSIGHVEVARLLISRDAAALTARTLDGETPLVGCLLR
jgi:ankyrin repeat protein